MKDVRFDGFILNLHFMKTIKYTSWQEDDFFIGYLNDYPDYLTQGTSKVELVENLKSLLIDLESGDVPYIRKAVARMERSVIRGNGSPKPALRFAPCGLHNLIDN